MLNSLQVLRAVAAWMVVYHHYVQIFYNLKVDGPVGKLFAGYGSLGVDLFFVISGFIMVVSTHGKRSSFLGFMRRRLLRIVPLYWVMTILTALLVFFFNELIPSTQFGPIFLIESLLFIPASNPSGIGYYPLLTVGWTLNYEMIFYLVFGSFLYLRESHKVGVVAAVMAIIVLVSPILGWGFYSNKIMLEFAIGSFIGIMWVNGKLTFPPVVAVTLIFLSIFFLYRKDPGHNYLYAGLPFAVVLASMLNLEKFFSGSKFKILVGMGDHSYATYLLHVLVISVAFFISKLVQVNEILMLLIISALIFFLSRVFYKYVEVSFRKKIETHIFVLMHWLKLKRSGTCKL